MARRKKYRVQRGPSADERVDAAICGEFSPEEQAWRERRQRFIAGLPPLAPTETLDLLEHAECVKAAATFHRLRKTVLAAPDGEEAWNGFGRRWLEHYGGGLPDTWWDGWPDDLRVYGGK